MANKDRYKEFDEYIVHREQGQKGKMYACQTTIGLQYVNVLKVSRYLHNTAHQLIDGNIISIDLI